MTNICIETNCTTYAIFNFEGDFAIYCKNHAKEYMIDVKNKKCIENECNTSPHFNNSGETKGLYL
jgi:hypothetical protein